jgi:hypothetical protein
VGHPRKERARKERGRAQKRGKESLSRHWLGEGSFGQDSLLTEIDPHLYAIDQKLCHHISQLAFHNAIKDGKPEAVIVSGPDAVPWLIPFMTDRYCLWIWGQEEDDLLNAAAASFNAEIFYGELPERLQGRASVAVLAHSHWAGPELLMDALRLFSQTLGAGGRVLTVLRGRMIEGEPHVEWEAGEHTALADLLAGNIFRFEPPVIVEEASLGEIGALRDFGISAFLLRHHEFFGEEARDLVLARMRERDFSDLLRDNAASSRIALLLGWSYAAS